MFCKHKWKVLSETTTESMAQHMINIIGQAPTPRDGFQADQLFKRKHIAIVACESCGKIKRYVEEV